MVRCVSPIFEFVPREEENVLGDADLSGGCAIYASKLPATAFALTEIAAADHQKIDVRQVGRVSSRVRTEQDNSRWFSDRQDRLNEIVEGGLGGSQGAGLRGGIPALRLFLIITQSNLGQTG